MSLLLFLIAAILVLTGVAVTAHLVHRNRRLLDYSANLAINLHAREQTLKLCSSRLPGLVQPEIVASFTTTRDRLHSAALAAQSIVLQTVRPSRVELYISDTVTPEEIPPLFNHLKDLGVTIHYVPDLGPHTKLIYALKDFPDAYIVTFDDDIYYPPHMIETLWRASAAAPGAVVGNWVRRLRFSRDGQVMKAKSGKLVTPKSLERHIDLPASTLTTGYDLFAYGTGGVLYPPDCMDERVFDVECFRGICPTEDDVWFKAMTLLKGTPVVATSLGHSPRHHCILGSQAVALRHTNYARSGAVTTSQIKAVFRHFSLTDKIDSLKQSAG